MSKTAGPGVSFIKEMTAKTRQVFMVKKSSITPKLKIGRSLFISDFYNCLYKQNNNDGGLQHLRNYIIWTVVSSKTKKFPTKRDSIIERAV